MNVDSGHSLHNCSCFLGAVDVTSVQGPGVVRFLAQLVVKLELQNEADEISAGKRVAAVISPVLDIFYPLGRATFGHVVSKQGIPK